MATRAFVSLPAKSVGVATRSRLQRAVLVRAAPKLTNPIELPSGSETTPVSLQEAMKFSGPAPERINGRLAMLGIVGALGAEVVTGQSVLTQFGQAALPVLAMVAALSYATLAPILRGANMSEAFGPLTPQAEKVNGRVAMLALAALLYLEVSRGSALL